VVFPGEVPLKGGGQTPFPRNAEKEGTHFILGYGNPNIRIHYEPGDGIIWEVSYRTT
jgi:hypothetical protein